MSSLSGFSSLAAIPEEKITEKITRRAGQKGMMVWWKIGPVRDEPTLSAMTLKEFKHD